MTITALNNQKLFFIRHPKTTRLIIADYIKYAVLYIIVLLFQHIILYMLYVILYYFRGKWNHGGLHSAFVFGGDH